MVVVESRSGYVSQLKGAHTNLTWRLILVLVSFNLFAPVFIKVK